jgi:hypothetical protein
LTEKILGNKFSEERRIRTCIRGVLKARVSALWAMRVEPPLTFTKYNLAINASTKRTT